MTPERWRQIKAAFHAALELTPAERSAFLDSSCDPALRAEVELLLSSCVETGALLDLSSLRHPTALADESTPDPWIGEHIGPYQVIARIGEGGMGVVYRAVRVDDQYVKQVAIKIIRTGPPSQELLRRFKNERQILASLEHPNIARLLDGGSTAGGVPYYVMEYIDGQPIDQFCDSHSLSVRARLDLFRHVCAAVQYAHQNLIVHRDLKPRNILVTPEGSPKLLDFGIAKLLDPELFFESTELTQSGLRPMTPEYASPEQFRGQPLTTATDVYSLGVILYRLLTSHAPYRIENLPPHEVARLVVETEPELPSAAVGRADPLSESKHGLTPEAVGRTRGLTPEALRRLLTGDLDTLVMKALNKDLARRYASVAELTEEIRRYLEGLPIRARRDTARYRAVKFVKRHKAGALAVTVTALALVTGMITTAWEAHVARTERLNAQQRYDDIRRLADSLIFQVDDAVKKLPGSTPARQILVKDAIQYLDRLARQPGDAPALQAELAAAYQKLGDVQGYFYESNLGDTAGASESYRKALEIVTKLSNAEPLNLQWREELARLYQRICAIRLRLGDNTGALESARHSLEIRESLATANPTNEQTRANLALSYDQLGDALVDSGKLDEALPLHREERAIFESLVASTPANPYYKRRLALCYKRIGGILEAKGRLADGLQKYMQALEVDQSLAAADPGNAVAQRDLSISYVNLGDILAKTGKPAEALDRYYRALAIDRSLAAADPTDARDQFFLASSYGRVGSLALQQRSDAAALRNYRRALAITQSLVAKDPLDATARNHLADSLAQLGEFYETTAQRPGASAVPPRHQWQQAKAWYQRSLDVWLDLSRRGVLLGLRAGEVKRIQEAIARCDVAIQGPAGAPSGKLETSLAR